MFQQFTKQGTPYDSARYQNRVPPRAPHRHRTGTAQGKTGYPLTPAALRIHSDSTGHGRHSDGTGGESGTPLESTEIPLEAPFTGTPYPYPRHKKTPAEAGA
jgi:hypothetical protein